MKRTSRSWSLCCSGGSSRPGRTCSWPCRRDRMWRMNRCRPRRCCHQRERGSCRLGRWTSTSRCTGSCPGCMPCRFGRYRCSWRRGPCSRCSRTRSRPTPRDSRWKGTRSWRCGSSSRRCTTCTCWSSCPMSCRWRRATSRARTGCCRAATRWSQRGTADSTGCCSRRSPTCTSCTSCWSRSRMRTDWHTRSTRSSSQRERQTGPRDMSSCRSTPTGRSRRCTRGSQ